MLHFQHMRSSAMSWLSDLHIEQTHLEALAFIVKLVRCAQSLACSGSPDLSLPVPLLPSQLTLSLLFRLQ